MAAYTPVWVRGLGWSKAFGVDWGAGAQWLTSSEHGMSNHMLWIFQSSRACTPKTWGSEWTTTKQPYSSKSTQACDKDACLARKCFPQDFVIFFFCFFFFSSHLFAAWTMSKWRTWAEGRSFGFALGDDLPPLLDLRFADDMLILARSSHEIMTLFDKLPS